MRLKPLPPSLYEYLGRGMNLKDAYDAACLELSDSFEISVDKTPKLMAA